MCEVAEMSGWSGFSEEELRRIQQKDSAGSVITARGRKPGPVSGRSRQQLQRERALQAAAQRSGGAGTQVLSPGQQLAAPPLKEEPRPAAAHPGASQAEVSLEKPRNGDPEPAVEEEKKPEVKELEKQEVELREKTRLELLQHEQQLIEERNKRKKALLTKTIAEKSKQTQAEAVKLKRIQRELQALDDSVSNDIGILRGKIEQASLDYNTARKRYDKAEAEYVTAKLDLHKKTEQKEQLAEHLCAIIQQNELRKAHKLEELMQQLQLQATEEELERQRKEEKKQQEEERKREEEKKQHEEEERKREEKKQEERKREEEQEQEQKEREEKKKQQEQEEERKRRDCSEAQINGKEGLEETQGVQSMKDSNIIKEEKGGDGPVSVKLPKVEKDGENVEEQSKAEVS